MPSRLDLMLYYLNEDGEEQPQDQQQDPNAPPPDDGTEGGDPNAASPMGGDPNAAAAMQQTAFLPKEEVDEDEQSTIDKEFPQEKDNQDSQQDIINFTNYQKLQYYHKFRDMLEFIDELERTMNKTKSMMSFDEMNDEEQHKIINLLLNTLDDIKDQIMFFLNKGIAQVNIDKTRVIFRAEIRKMNLVIDKFEEIMRNVKNKDSK